MAKVTGPLFSLDARGKVGDAIVYSFWRGINYVRGKVTPANPRSTEQVAIRDLVTDASQAWSGETSPIDSAYKAAYNTAAAGQPYSGFNLYMKDACIKNANESYDGSLDIPTGPGDQTP